MLWQALAIYRLKREIAIVAPQQSHLASSPGQPRGVDSHERYPSNPKIRRQPSNTHGVFHPAHALRDQGIQNPESTLESMYWAINAGESKRMATLIEISTAAHETVRQFYDRLPAESRAGNSMQEVVGLWLTGGIEPISGFEVISSVEGADDKDFDAALRSDSSYRTIRLKVHWSEPTARTVEQRFLFHHTDQGWLWVLTPDLVFRVTRFASSYRPQP
jgi:hypothetical protein